MSKAVGASLFIAVLAIGSAAQASVEISSAATNNMSCSAGVCSPTAKKAVLNVDDLTAMLATEDVKITTGNGAVTITVLAPFSWTSTHRLTLDAYYNVTFQAPVVVAGTGAVTIVTNDGGAGGDLIFFPGAKLDFWDTRSNLVINGATYKIATDFARLVKDIVGNASGNYALAKNVEGKTYRTAPISDSFAGHLEGLGNTISNFSLRQRNKDAASGGFFAEIGTTGSVHNVAFVDANMRQGNQSAGIGILAGVNSGTISRSLVSGVMHANHASAGGFAGGNNGTISESSASVTISDPVDAGAITGLNAGLVANCSSAGNVSGQLYAGGLAGSNSGVVSGSHTSATVAGQSVGGGAVGSNSGRIEGSSAAGDVYGLADGGLVGENLGAILSSYSTGKVGGSGASPGGLVGEEAGGTIENSYATDAVDGKNAAYWAGGFLGYNAGDTATPTIKSSYSVGAVAGSNGRGGFIGYNQATEAIISSVYWDLDTSGVSNGCGEGACSGVVGLTDAQLKSGLPAGFDPKIWTRNPNINNGYPYLLANPPPQ